MESEWPEIVISLRRDRTFHTTTVPSREEEASRSHFPFRWSGSQLRLVTHWRWPESLQIISPFFVFHMITSPFLSPLAYMRPVGDHAVHRTWFLFMKTRRKQLLVTSTRLDRSTSWNIPKTNSHVSSSSTQNCSVWTKTNMENSFRMSRDAVSAASDRIDSINRKWSVLDDSHSFRRLALYITK